MSNNYFSFKRFTVHQQHCAMKVCTDACLFGAWASRAFQEIQPAAETMLDIGTGTGLLSLLLAQQWPGLRIDAVETDMAAATQAQENIINSPFSHVNVIHRKIQAHAGLTYDLIICNPPFYEDDLKSPDTLRNAAMHDSELTLEQLVDQFDRLLSPGGLAAVLVPYSRWIYLRQVAGKKGFSLSQVTHVKQTYSHDPFRSMMLFSRRESGRASESFMSIHDNTRHYTPEFVSLLQPYYLYL